MLYEFVAFSDQIEIANILRYITFRTWLALLASFAIAAWLGRFLWLDIGRKSARGAPRGVSLPIFGATFLFANLANWYVWIIAGVMIVCALVENSRRMFTSSAIMRRIPFILLLVAAAGAGWCIDALGSTGFSSALTFPFLKDLLIPLGSSMILFNAFLIVVASIVFKLTFRTDNSASLAAIIVMAPIAITAYLTGNAAFTRYLQIHYVQGVGELSVLVFAAIGSLLGYTLHKVGSQSAVMTDSNASALGGLVGCAAAILKMQLLAFSALAVLALFEILRIRKKLRDVPIVSSAMFSGRML